MHSLKIRKINIPLKTGGKIIIAYSISRVNFDLRGPGRLTKTVLASRAAFLKKIGVGLEDAVFLEQVHGAGVCSAATMDRGRGAYSYARAIKKSDAAVTAAANLALCILTADCLNLFFYHPKTSSIGIAHAGWRGTAKKIAIKTVQKMVADFGGKSRDIQVYIGPGIGSCCYEVSKNFKKIFPASLVRQNGKIFLDLARENQRQLESAGVKNIHNIGFCTSCRKQAVFSFRQGDLQKRILAVIARIL